MRGKYRLFTIPVLIVLVVLMGFHVYNLHKDRANAFASYFLLARQHLYTARSALESYLQREPGFTLDESRRELQDFQQVVRAMADYLSTWQSRENWCWFANVEWPALDRSLINMAERERYYATQWLPVADFRYLQRLSKELKGLEQAMETTVRTGNHPRVDLSPEKVRKLAVKAQEAVEMATCFMENGVLPEEVPKTKIDVQKAEALARSVSELSRKEWRLEEPVLTRTRLRQDQDYYLLNFRSRQNSGQVGTVEARTVTVGVDRRNGKLVLKEQHVPPTGGSVQINPETLQHWTEQAVRNLPGPKKVLEIYPHGEGVGYPWAVVVPLVQSVPVYTDRVILNFAPRTGEILRYENYHWGTAVEEVEPKITLQAARQTLVEKLGLDPERLEDKGLIIARSDYTDRPTLVYRFWYTKNAAPNQLERRQYIVNARNGRFEGGGYGW